MVNKELIVKSGSGLPDNSHDKTLSMFRRVKFSWPPHVLSHVQLRYALLFQLFKLE